MACQTVQLPGGQRAIVCGSRAKAQRCECGRVADRLCDWKVEARKSGTCDKPVCWHCTTSPAPDKDLCMDHASAWNARRLRKGAA